MGLADLGSNLTTNYWNKKFNLFEVLSSFVMQPALRQHWERAMAPHSSTLAWKIPWMEEPGRLQSMGSLRVGHDWSDLAAAAAKCKKSIDREPWSLTWCCNQASWWCLEALRIDMKVMSHTWHLGETRDQISRIPPIHGMLVARECSRRTAWWDRFYFPKVITAVSPRLHSLL